MQRTLNPVFQQGNKEVKSSKSAVADIPSGGTRNIKSMWEKGNVGSSESPAPTVKVRGERWGGGGEQQSWTTESPLFPGCGGHQRRRGRTGQQLEGKACRGGQGPGSCTGARTGTSTSKTSSEPSLFLVTFLHVCFPENRFLMFLIYAF